MKDIHYDIKVLIVEQITVLDREPEFADPFEHLRPSVDATTTLAQLCRVNREWFEAARPSMLRAVRLDIFSARTLSFLAFLASPEGPSLREKIEVLEIVGKAGGTGSTPCDDGCETYKKIQEGLEPLLPELSSLRTLFVGYTEALVNCRWFKDAIQSSRQIVNFSMTRSDFPGHLTPNLTGFSIRAEENAARFASTLVGRAQGFYMTGSRFFGKDLVEHVFQSRSLKELALFPEGFPLNGFRLHLDHVPPVSSSKLALNSLRVHGLLQSPRRHAWGMLILRLILANHKSLRILVLDVNVDVDFFESLRALAFPGLKMLALPDDSDSPLGNGARSVLDCLLSLPIPELQTLHIAAKNSVYLCLLKVLDSGRASTLKHVMATKSPQKYDAPSTEEEDAVFKKALADRSIGFTLGFRKW